MSDRHLTADLNVRDDDGFGWTTLNETNGLGRVRTEIMLLTGSSRTMAVVRVTAADDDGWVHFSNLPGAVAQNCILLGRIVAQGPAEGRRGRKASNGAW